jgi:hypothetical protein
MRDDTMPAMMMAAAINSHVDAAAVSKYMVTNHAAMQRHCFYAT